jgi:hypothetical protein
MLTGWRVDDVFGVVENGKYFEVEGVDEMTTDRKCVVTKFGISEFHSLQVQVQVGVHVKSIKYYCL